MQFKISPTERKDSGSKPYMMRMATLRENPSLSKRQPLQSELTVGIAASSQLCVCALERWQHQGSRNI